jgi:hypothetical protein
MRWLSKIGLGSGHATTGAEWKHAGHAPAKALPLVFCVWATTVWTSSNERFDVQTWLDRSWPKHLVLSCHRVRTDGPDVL